jgi:hypothetical protein
VLGWDDINDPRGSNMRQRFLLVPGLLLLALALIAALYVFDAGQVLSVVLVLAVLALASIALVLFVRMQMQYRALAKYLAGRYRVLIIADPGDETRTRAALERREFIGRALQNESSRFVEIIETPPGFESINRRELRPDEGAAQLATLRWQLEDTTHLLLGRVVDLLKAVSRRTERPLAEVCTCVRLSPRRTTRLGGLPLSVVVETGVRGLVSQELSNYRDWLGVAVEADQPILRRPFGMCQVHGGAEGQVGGKVLTPQGIKYLACAHVISPNCSAALYRAPLAPVSAVPDLAVLADLGNCFSSGLITRDVSAVNLDASKYLAEHAVRRLPGQHRPGKVYIAPTLLASYAGRIHQFPHAQIAPRIYTVLDLVYWPPWGTHFSRRGDSGSWVVTDDGRWLGMLVSGSEFHRLSDVVLSGPLLDFMMTQGLCTQVDRLEAIVR